MPSLIPGGVFGWQVPSGGLWWGPLWAVPAAVLLGADAAYVEEVAGTCKLARPFVPGHADFGRICGGPMPPGGGQAAPCGRAGGRGGVHAPWTKLRGVIPRAAEVAHSLSPFDCHKCTGIQGEVEAAPVGVWVGCCLKLEGPVVDSPAIPLKLLGGLNNRVGMCQHAWYLCGLESGHCRHVPVKAQSPCKDIPHCPCGTVLCVGSAAAAGSFLLGLGCLHQWFWKEFKQPPQTAPVVSWLPVWWVGALRYHNC